MLNDEMMRLIEETKAAYKHEWHTAVVDEMCRLFAVVKAGLHSNEDLKRLHLLRRFVGSQVRAADMVVTVLEFAPREGSMKDIPEGLRYIKISDTLANELANSIRIGNPLTVSYAVARLDV
jgi:hypothetical protein